MSLGTFFTKLNEIDEGKQVQKQSVGVMQNWLFNKILMTCLNEEPHKENQGLGKLIE